MEGEETEQNAGDANRHTSVLQVVEAMELDPDAWFYPKRQLILTHTVGDTDATRIRTAFEDGIFPDGTPLSEITRVSVDERVIEALTAYAESPSEWRVRTEERLDFWPDIRTRYERGDIDTARYRVVERFDTVVPVTDGKDVTLHRYNPKTGIYQADGARFVREQLETELGAANTRSETEEILYKLRSRPALESDAFGAEGQICVANGVLSVNDPTEPTLREHAPERRFRTRLPIEYDPTAECPRFERFVERRVGGPRTLQEYLGYLLCHPWGNPHRKAMLLVGPTAAGKSTLLRVVEGLLGSEAVTNHPLARVAQEQRPPPRTVANVYDTVDRLPETGERLTQRLGGEPVAYDDPAQKHVFAATHLPKFKPGTGRTSFLRRWLFVRLPHTIPRDERKQDMANTLLKERSGILNWALAGYRRLRSNGAFSDERTIGAKRTLWRARRSPIDYFVYTHTTQEENSTERTDHVYEAYERFCAERGLVPRSRQDLVEHVRQVRDVATAQQTEGDQTRTYYRNLALRSPHHMAEGKTEPGQVPLDPVSQE